MIPKNLVSYCLYLVIMSAFFLAETGAVRAEVYRGIAPYYSLNDTKALFPGATIEDVKPAWAKDGEHVFSFSGSGIEGQIIVKVSDWEAGLRRSAAGESYCDEMNLVIDAYYQDVSGDQRLIVDWVRWYPDTPFPLRRLTSRYGNPNKKGFGRDDYRPYLEWNRGVSANLADNEKYVSYVEYTYTTDELERACFRGISRQARLQKDIYIIVAKALNQKRNSKAQATASAEP